MKIGTPDQNSVLEYLETFDRSGNDGLQELRDSKLGILVTVNRIKSKYSRKEENGFHWLLDQWLNLDRSLTVDSDTFKTQILKAHFGVIRFVGFSGQEELKPVRTTTKIWDHDKNKYVYSPLSREGYAELITWVYDIAAQPPNSINLPILKKDEAA